MNRPENHPREIVKNRQKRRIVIDTNVCLDLFVFHDSRSQALMQLLKNGLIKAVTRSDCRDEWLRILSRPSLFLNEAARQNSMAAYDEMFFCSDFKEKNDRLLPVCRDQDDQKFLELAYAANAGFLVTKDKALLKLAKKTEKSGLFRIIKPEQSCLIPDFIK